MFTGLATGVTDLVFGASGSKEAPSTPNILATIGQASADVQLDCLRENPLAPLDPNYQGAFQPGDTGVDPVLPIGPY